MKFALALAGLISVGAMSVAAAQSADNIPKTPLPPMTPVVPFGEPGHGMLTVKDLMRHILNPAAETFWLAGGEIDTNDKRNSRTPTTDAQWNAALAAAATVVEAGNLLQVQGRAVPDPDWAKWSTDLNKAGVAGVKAVQARDGEATFAAGSAMFDACRSCHVKYIRMEKQEWAPLPDVPADFGKPQPKPKAKSR